MCSLQNGFLSHFSKPSNLLLPKYSEIGILECLDNKFFFFFIWSFPSMWMLILICILYHVPFESLPFVTKCFHFVRKNKSQIVHNPFLQYYYFNLILAVVNVPHAWAMYSLSERPYKLSHAQQISGNLPRIWDTWTPHKENTMLMSRLLTLSTAVDFLSNTAADKQY